MKKNENTYKEKLIAVAKELGWQYSEIHSKLALLTHTALPSESGISVRPEFMVEDLQEAVEKFDIEKYFDLRYMQRHHGNPSVPGVQELLQEAKDVAFAQRSLLEAWELIPEDDTVKNFWMRAGISIPLNAKEFRLVCEGGDEGMKIIQNRIARGAFSLDGESYAPANLGNTADDEWKHEEINFDF